MIDMSDYVNKRFSSGSFSVSDNENVQYGSYPDGTEYKRLLYTNSPVKMRASLVLSPIETIRFRTFFTDTLRFGLRDFYFYYPLNQRKTKMSFIKPFPVYSSYNGTHFEVSLNIKVYENDTIE